MIDLLYRTHDVLLIKLLRNLTRHEAPARQLLQYAADLMALAQQVDTPELLVELLGIIGSLPLKEIDELPELLHKYSLIEFLSRHLVPGCAPPAPRARLPHAPTHARVSPPPPPAPPHHV